ncbi:MAG: alpha/beta fold hydrolase [Nitriliruptorales bacterium]|nr:alpha/beta fold hydrolase [Nitriliruptorales bacterium]
MAEVLPGAEAWSAEGGDVGVLVLHGLTGNPVSTRPLAEALARAGFAVEMPRLPGHGTVWQELAKATWHDWVREAVDALARLRRRTRARVAVGISMGGTIGLHLAESHGEDLAGIVVINPSVYSGDPRLKALPFLKWVIPGLPGIGNDIARPGGDEKPYARLPLKALASFLQMQRMVRDHLAAVTVPTLIFSSRVDHVVEQGNGDVIMEGIQSTEVERIWLERSYHVATLDYDADMIEERTVAFVRRVTSVVP